MAIFQRFAQLQPVSPLEAMVDPVMICANASFAPPPFQKHVFRATLEKWKKYVEDRCKTARRNVCKNQKKPQAQGAAAGQAAQTAGSTP
jgi:hypothetical protein